MAVSNLKHHEESFGIKSFCVQPPDDSENMEDDFDDPSRSRKRSLPSSVVAATNFSAKKRTQFMEEQKEDTSSLARNKRMFGMMLGTLQKFRKEETTRSILTSRREEIEKKLENDAEEEKVLAKKRKEELLREERLKKQEHRKSQLKQTRQEGHDVWEKNQQFVSSFIQTKTKPSIFYIPRIMTSEMEKRQKDTKNKYRMIIAEKRAKLQKDLQEIDDKFQIEIDAIDDGDKQQESSTHKPNDDLSDKS